VGGDERQETAVVADGARAMIEGLLALDGEGLAPLSAGIREPRWTTWSSPSPAATPSRPRRARRCRPRREQDDDRPTRSAPAGRACPRRRGAPDDHADRDPFPRAAPAPPPARATSCPTRWRSPGAPS
jgi:hypothetical protein